jgi:hypothetical protein
VNAEEHLVYLVFRKDHDAHQEHRLEAVGAEQIGNHLRQLLDVVPESSSTELAEVCQVFAQLSGLDTGRLGQRLAGNGSNCVVL